MCGEKVLYSFGLKQVSGITPAYAGKRKSCAAQKTSAWDHPRMCGEKLATGSRTRKAAGSPPHVRGKESEKPDCDDKRRITPACAGKRPAASAPVSGQRDHPRMCGEKRLVSIEPRSACGSPPHVRGKVHGLNVGKAAGGITPACAGKRLKRSRSTVPPVAIVPLFPSVCNKPVVSDGSPAGRDAPLFLPAENAVPASPAYNLRSL